jgi:hypothetical protein
MSRADALEYFLVDVVGMPREMFDGMKQSPMYPGMLGAAHTLIYDNTLMYPNQQGQPLPREWADEVGSIPALCIDGANSPDWMRNAVQALAELLPNGRRLTLEGCDHSAPPETVAAVLTDFFGGKK